MNFNTLVPVEAEINALQFRYLLVQLVMSQLSDIERHESLLWLVSVWRKRAEYNWQRWWPQATLADSMCQSKGFTF